MVLQMIVIQTLQLTRSITDSDTASSRLPMRSSCIMLNFFKHQLNADSRVRTHMHTSLYLHTHTTLILYLFIKYAGYNCNHVILSFNVYVNFSNYKGEASRPGPADCSVELFNRVRKIL